MERYESIYYRGGAEISNVLRTVANHYIGMNPPEPFTFCAFSREGPGWDRNGCLCMDLREKLPDAKQGENAYAAFRIWSDSEEENGVLRPCQALCGRRNGIPIFRDGGGEREA